jgi:tRNA pseudouridine65 synthase
VGLLSILYRDEHLVAIDKPDGLLVHRSRISNDHVFALQLLRDQVNRRVYPAHRLDRPVSGVLLFALDPVVAARLGDAFAERRVAKTYIALVRGVTDEQGIVDHPLREDGDGELQEATTRYRRLATAEVPVAVPPHPSARYSLVEAEPLTGRMHQIRRHFRSQSHPIIGDTQHGDGRHNRLFRERFGVWRLLLHARRLRFTHPVDGREMVIEAPVPADMQSLFGQLGWANVPV